LKFKEKELLSWRIIAEILLYIEKPVGIAVLHPGGGQYDTLSLVTKESEVFLSLNRNGSSALINNQIVGDIWEIASKNFNEAISMLTELGGLNQSFKEQDKNSILSIHISKLVDRLEKNPDLQESFVWGWIDSPFGSGPNYEVLQSFSFPGSWKTADPLIPGTGWESNVFISIMKENPQFAFNLVLGSWLPIS
jgi:hypothetical protein